MTTPCLAATAMVLKDAMGAASTMEQGQESSMSTSPLVIEPCQSPEISPESTIKTVAPATTIGIQKAAK